MTTNIPGVTVIENAQPPVGADFVFKRHWTAIFNHIAYKVLVNSEELQDAANMFGAPGAQALLDAAIARAILSGEKA